MLRDRGPQVGGRHREGGSAVTRRVFRYVPFTIEQDETAEPEYEARCVSGDEAECGAQSGMHSHPRPVEQWQRRHTQETGHLRYRRDFGDYAVMQPPGGAGRAAAGERGYGVTFALALERPWRDVWPLVAQTDDGNRWVTGACWLYCRRKACACCGSGAWLPPARWATRTRVGRASRSLTAWCASSRTGGTG
ncbi:DUF7848 domain-containing protein [Streptomyces sp. 7N604]|uniref:DUF7848 domain-containing protein n=1 Tax=Streptomyces sp. 7N604 TaxID=3457415 RepID=UPI003FD1F289